jgi:mono/diheme cytochrome c family protein
LAGEVKYKAACQVCHAAGTTYAATGNNFKTLNSGSQGNVVADLGKVSGVMNGITLTTAEITNLKAFLAAVK